jgi:hypothetical protein
MPWMDRFWQWVTNKTKSLHSQERREHAESQAPRIDPTTDPIILKLMPPRAPVPPPYFPSPQGRIEGIGRTLISGWIWDANSPNVPQEIEIWDSDVLVMKVVADGLRSDLVKAGIGDGRHGFQARLPRPIEVSMWRLGAAYCRVDAMHYRLPMQPNIRSLDDL